MYSSIIIVAVAALVSTSRALTIRNKHVGDFRLFSDEGCSAGNLGVWTVIDDDVRDHPCQGIPDDTNVRSVFVTDVDDNCEFSLYEDADCQAGEQDTTQDNCYNSAAGWKAWKMTC
uniref:Uncharacterized protein n=1 Tax=Photinus pyralis TaxID=7054 RepID=A0A1Y1NMD0_PHOPY